MRVLALVTDAFGGRGGIAKLNRDLLTAISTHPECTEVVVVPRLAPEPPGVLPAGIKFVGAALGGKGRYIHEALRVLLTGGKFDMVWCAHINLLSLAWFGNLPRRVPLILDLHGIEVWTPTRSRLTNYLSPKVDAAISITQFTKKRFSSWSGLPLDKIMILSPTVDLSLFGPGPQSAELLRRYGLAGKKVLLTVGRIASEERYKGFDEVIDLMPRLLAKTPNLAYLIVGDGSDRVRLESKVAQLGLQRHVIFAGHISEAEKADHYRLADAYVMPSYGEGFAMVHLEALACGIPTLASKLDGSQEAIKNGELGIVSDPKNPEQLFQDIQRVLASPRGAVPPGLADFAYPSFEKRCHAIVNQIRKSTAPGQIPNELLS